MSTTFLFNLRRDRTQILDREVRSWKAEQVPTISPHDVSDVVKECLCFPAEMRRGCNSVCDRAAVNQLESFEETGRALQSLPPPKRVAFCQRCKLSADLVEATAVRSNRDLGNDKEADRVQREIDEVRKIIAKLNPEAP